ncbi:PQQ-binding-like beta-propeller repeat protein [Jiangella muralis]|uniref:PQQ-binding-like beta-propeller repeat protein n=1 Tax=Jiangella muralis TaxID=702383 RepID=UPI00069EC6D0|nr:PQQ-binding-like beta-propeller repeat protein [Jiangella muralis]
MSDTRVRLAAIVAVATFALTACGDDSEPSATETGTDAPSEQPSDQASTPEQAEFACPPEFLPDIPEGLDPADCWSQPGLERPVLVDDTVFALYPDPADPDAPGQVVALDAETGAQRWMSAVLPGEVAGLHAVDVGGDPGIAVLVTEQDSGDALTEASESWGYLAWPSEAGDGDDAPAGVEPAEHVTVPKGENPHIEVYWTDQGVLAGDFILKPGATEFTPVNMAPEPMVLGAYDLDESFTGFSGDLLLSYVRGQAWLPDGPSNGETYVGWLARSADGTEAWNNVVGTPNQEDTLFGEGPVQVVIVVGEYLLTITPTDENYTAFELSWLDAATNTAATPTAADLEGAEPSVTATDIMADTTALLSPDGKHLFASWSTLALIIDVEAGTATRVPTDFAVHGSAIDDRTFFGSTENGSLTIDLASGEATAIEAPRQPFDVVDGDFGAAILEGDIGEPSYLIGGRRTTS